MRRWLFNVAAAASLAALLMLMAWRFFGGVTRANTYFLWNLDTGLGARTEVHTDYGLHVGGMCLPFWPLVLLSLVAPAAWVAGALLQRFDPEIDQPLHPQLCPTCGYDLRATPDRCPECGTEPVLRSP